MEQRVVPLPFTSCAMSPGMTSQARSISCQTTLRKILSTKNCSLFRSFSRRTKPKSELESTTSKYSGPLTKHERVCRRPTGIWKHYEKSCPTRKRKQSLGGDLWNSGQPSFAASVSSQLSRDKAMVTLLQNSWHGGLPLLPLQVSNRGLLGRFFEGESMNGTTLRVCAGWRLDLLLKRSDMEKSKAKQTVSNLTEAEAIKQAKEGDAAAFEFLYKSHCRRVYSLCLRMIQIT